MVKLILFSIMKISGVIRKILIQQRFWIINNQTKWLPLIKDLNDSHPRLTTEKPPETVKTGDEKGDKKDKCH